MENEIKNWEQMHRAFNAVRNGKMSPRAADSIVLAWPVVTQIIKEAMMDTSRVLVYGCGTGGFCRHLRSLGMKVEGIDFSPSMIQAAVERSSRHILYHAGGRGTLERLKGAYDVITSLMVFQFMKDFETYLPLFRDLLADRGIMIFAVHNPHFVEDCCRNGTGFRSPRQAGKTKVVSMEIDKSAMIDTYVRDKEQYRKLFEKYGFEYISARYPQFTPEFVTEYRWKLPSDNAEHLIMTFRKKV